MNTADPAPIIPETGLRLAEARLSAFDRDGLGHTLDALREWSAARAADPACQYPPPPPVR